LFCPEHQCKGGRGSFPIHGDEAGKKKKKRMWMKTPIKKEKPLELTRTGGSTGKRWVVVARSLDEKEDTWAQSGGSGGGKSTYLAVGGPLRNIGGRKKHLGPCIMGSN